MSITTAATAVRLTTAVEVPKSFVDEYIAVYKHLHAHPELSAQEFETATYIESRLAGLGIESFRCGTTAVVGVLANGAGPVIGFRADTDGPPIAEQTGLDYSSENALISGTGPSS